MIWTHRPARGNATAEVWELRMEAGDAPRLLHPRQLARELWQLTGDKPSIGSRDGPLVVLRFHIDLTALLRDAVEVAVAAHDGSAELATDAAAAASEELARASALADVEAVRAKRRDGRAYSAADRDVVMDHLLKLFG